MLPHKFKEISPPTKQSLTQLLSYHEKQASSPINGNMQALREFEIKAIRLLGGDSLSENQLSLLCGIERPLSYEYTGCGYFLVVKHPSFPTETKTLSEPPVVGKSGNVQAGFVLFLGKQELTLECHTWGEVDVPENFRDLEVTIGTPPINLIGSNS